MMDAIADVRGFNFCLSTDRTMDQHYLIGKYTVEGTEECLSIGLAVRVASVVHQEEITKSWLWGQRRCV